MKYVYLISAAGAMIWLACNALANNEWGYFIVAVFLWAGVGYILEAMGKK